MRNDKIILITNVPDGENISEKEFPVFAEKKSVARTEFYAAYGVGLNARWTFNINPGDYESTRVVLNGEEFYASQIIYNEARFDIVRTYQSNIDNMEVVVK